MPGYDYISTTFSNLYEIVHLTNFKFYFFMFGICSLSPHQDTPLHTAAVNGHTDTVHYLTDNGAGINITNNIGVSE